VTFLFVSRDYAFSIVGVAGYLLISILTSYLLVGLRFAEHFPKLNSYYFFPRTGTEEPLSEKEWALKQAEYLESSFSGKRIFLTPAEDGLICVPLLIVGINPFTALLGGFAFAFLHIGRFTYLECIGKGVIYSLVCFLILPSGLLTVVVGHFAMDALGLATLRLIKQKLRNDINHTS
jgi:hypothetical protein